MTYRDQPFNKRFAVMGDEAEGVFKDIEPLGQSQRLGWRRPKVSIKRMGETLRHMPDFYCDSGHIVEVVGLGRDGVLKLKLSKYEALKTWAKIAELMLFVWNSHERQWVLLSWDQTKRLVTKARNAGVEEFNDGNEYYPIQWEWITSTASYVGNH